MIRALPDGGSRAPTLDPAAFERLLAALENRGTPADLPATANPTPDGPVPLAVIAQPDVFAACLRLQPQFGPGAPALRGRRPTITLAGERPVRVDLGDGSGSHPLAPGESLTADYQKTDQARLTVSREQLVAHCQVPISDAPAPVAHEIWDLPGGTVWVQRAPGHSAMRCPLIVVEGFPGGHGYLFSHDLLAQHGVLGELQAAGHDLLVVGLDDGTRPLAENVEVLEACLAEVRTRTLAPATVLGWSMGGLLARLALSALEGRGIDHRVATLVTWDTPHRGTVTNLGVQWFVEHFAAQLPALEGHRRLLSSAANQEMDLLVVNGESAAASPRRAALLSLLHWPERPRRVLLASGRGDGRCSISPGSCLLRWHGCEHGALELHAMGSAAAIAEGRLRDSDLAPLRAAGQPAWDGMPGGRMSYVGQVAEMLRGLDCGTVSQDVPATCTVPTVSALDVEGPPDLPVPQQPALIHCQEDQAHLAIDAAAAARLVEQIGAPFDPAGFDPHDPDFLADPFPTYARFRDWAPITPVSLNKSTWCFRAEDCREILEQTECWLKHPPQDAGSPSAPQGASAPPGLFSADPPDHGALRAAVEPPFREALAQAPSLAQEAVERILDRLKVVEQIELVRDFALPLPAAVLFTLLGVPAKEDLRQQLISWQGAITAAHDTTQAPSTLLQGAACAAELRAWCTTQVEGHGKHAEPGLIRTLCDAFERAGLPSVQLAATLFDLVMAGYLSTTFLLGTGVWRLLMAPDVVSRLREEPDLLPAAVDELLRLDGPVQVIDRYAAADNMLGGHQFARGAKVTAVVGSGDRDAALFDDADELRLDRGGTHLAFGAGVHTCIGAPLVRLVAPVALAALLKLSTLELDGEPQWQTDPYLRSVTSLPMRIAA